MSGRKCFNIHIRILILACALLFLTLCGGGVCAHAAVGNDVHTRYKNTPCDSGRSNKSGKRRKKKRVSDRTMMLYGGLKRKNSSHGKKRISGKRIESHNLRNTSLKTARSRMLFDDYYAYLKAGHDTGRDWEWVFERTCEWPDQERFNLEAVIEWELFGYVCDPQCYPLMYTDNYTMAEYRRNLPYKRKLEKLARKMCSRKMTEREASALFVKYITKRLHFRGTQPCRDARAYLAWKNRAGNCQAYSRLYKTMCNAVGIKCDLVVGKTIDDAPNGGHTWNRVNIDGKWYYMDLTWYDSEPLYPSFYLYRRSLWRDHSIESIF